MRICSKGSSFVAAFALALSAGLAAAQEPPADEVHAEKHEPANEIA